MRRSRALILAIIVGIVCSFITYFLVEAKYETGDKALSVEEFSRALRLMQTHYLKDFDMEEVQYAGLKAMVAALGDPYSVYYTPEEFETFNQNSSGEYYGVGMGITVDEITGLAVVTHFMDDSAAQQAGIEVGDFILSVNGEDVTKKSLAEIRILCIGEEGTSLTIGVRRDNQTIEYTMKRRSVSLDMVESEILDNGIGYMRIKQFGGNCASLFDQGMQEFKQNGARGIVFDLRNNPGGYLDTVVKVLDKLLPEGIIVYTEDKDGKRETWQSDSDSITTPIVVLVNGHTASASEIFAGAIQDYAVGAVVGTRTYGKGVVQVVIPIAETGGGLKITSSQYFTPNGRSIDGNGIYPDYYVENSDGVDVQLEKAVEVIELLIADEALRP